MDDRTKILGIIEKINDEDWSEFVRDKLNLDDETIAKIEDSRVTRSEKRYLAVRKWMANRSGSDCIEELLTLSETALKKDGANALPTTFPMQAAASAQPRKKKGLALIMGNGFENDTEQRRPASEKDLEKMKQLWSTEIGCSLYENKVHKNLSAEKMKEKLQSFAAKAGEVGCDYLVVYVSTHGNTVFVRESDDAANDAAAQTNAVFMGEDNNFVTENKLKAYFGKNKIGNDDVIKFLILDFCRGDDTIIDSGPPNTVAEYVERPPIPVQSNIISIYGAHREYTTVEGDDGSLLTNCLYEIFKMYWSTHSLTDMLTLVNQRTKRQINLGNAETRSMSIFESSLVDDFTFYKTQSP